MLLSKNVRQKSVETLLITCVILCKWSTVRSGTGRKSCPRHDLRLQPRAQAPALAAARLATGCRRASSTRFSGTPMPARDCVPSTIHKGHWLRIMSSRCRRSSWRPSGRAHAKAAVGLSDMTVSDLHDKLASGQAVRRSARSLQGRLLPSGSIGRSSVSGNQRHFSSFRLAVSG